MDREKHDPSVVPGRASYQKGCRCGKCKAANAAYSKGLYEKKKQIQAQCPHEHWRKDKKREVCTRCLKGRGARRKSQK